MLRSLMRRNLIIGLTVLVALVVAVSAISATKTSDETAGSAVAVSASPASSSGAGQEGAAIAPFTARDVDGRGVKVGSGKPGALFFFAGWCDPCLREARALAEVQRELGERVAITAISPDPTDSEGAIRSFRRNAGNPRYPFIWDSAGTLGTQFVVQALDTTIVYDKTGTVVFRDAAVSDAETLRAAFRKAGVS